VLITAPNVDAGQEWLIDAAECEPGKLRDAAVLSRLCGQLVAQLGLTVVAPPQWHTFPGEGGVTGLLLLSESHLAVHTFPEHGYLALNLYSCRERAAPDFGALCREAVGAGRVQLRELKRGPA